MRSINTDLSDERLNTQAPFLWDCSCTISGERFSAADILECQVMLHEGDMPPVRITRIEAADTGFKFIFTANGKQVAYAYVTGVQQTANELGYATVLLYDDAGIISGHMTVTYDAIARIVKLLSGLESIKLDRDAFVLLPSCCVPALSTGVRSFMLNGTPVTADIQLSSDAYTETPTTVVQASGYCTVTSTINAFGAEPEDASNEGITKLMINGNSSAAINVKGKHLILRPSLTSNLRTVTATGITLKGVTDD